MGVGSVEKMARARVSPVSWSDRLENRVERVVEAFPCSILHSAFLCLAEVFDHRPLNSPVAGCLIVFLVSRTVWINLLLLRL